MSLSLFLTPFFFWEDLKAMNGKSHHPVFVGCVLFYLESQISHGDNVFL